MLPAPPRPLNSPRHPVSLGRCCRATRPSPRDRRRAHEADRRGRPASARGCSGSASRSTARRRRAEIPPAMPGLLGACALAHRRTEHRSTACPGRTSTLISEMSHYRLWWPWLRAFEAAALAEGEEWRCEVQPPVPYAGAVPRRHRARRGAGAGVGRRQRGRGGRCHPPLDEGFRGARPRCTARSRRGTRPCRWSPGLPPPSPVSAMTGSSTRGPASSSPALSSRSWATRQPWREVLVPPDPGLRRRCGDRCGDRLDLRGQGDHRRRGHRLGRRHHGDGFGGAVDRKGPRGGQTGGGPGARDLDVVAQARGHRRQRRDTARRRPRRRR